MKLLNSNEAQNPAISGGHPLVGAAVGGAITASVWGAWTTFIDHKPEKVTLKKSGLIFTLGAIASFAGILVA